MNASAARAFVVAGWIAVTGALGGCGAGGRMEWVVEHPLGCRLDEQRLVRDTLYFGRAMPGAGEVDDGAWRDFENDTLAATFPRGYSVVEANGHWRGADGAPLAERSRIVLAVHEDDAASEQRVGGAIALYRERFHQQSVLRERGAVCATF